MNSYLKLIRFDKPVGTILLLWPTLWGLWLAYHGSPRLIVLSIFLLGVFLMRSAGCVINDLADRNYDGMVERTKNRPLVTSNRNEKLSIGHAIAVLFLLLVLAFVLLLSLLYLTNNYNVLKHAIIALCLAALYPFCKRFINCPQFVLGLAFGYAIPFAFIVTNNNIPIEAWVLYSMSVIHSIIYDTFYAMSDIKDDLKIGVKSSAIWFQKLFGRYDYVVMACLQVIFLTHLYVLAYLLEFSYYHILIIIVWLLFIYQIILIKTRDPKKCLQAFKNNNWVGLIVFIYFVLEYI